MKLQDIKQQVDTFFDSVSEEDLFVMLTQKYGMPEVYDFGSPIVVSPSEVTSKIEFTEINYQAVQETRATNAIDNLESLTLPICA